MTLMYSDYDYEHDRRYRILVPRHGGAQPLCHAPVYGLYLISLFTAVPAFLASSSPRQAPRCRRHDRGNHYSYAIAPSGGPVLDCAGDPAQFVLVGFVALGLLWLWFCATCAGGWRCSTTVRWDEQARPGDQPVGTRRLERSIERRPPRTGSSACAA